MPSAGRCARTVAATAVATLAAAGLLSACLSDDPDLTTGRRQLRSETVDAPFGPNSETSAAEDRAPGPSAEPVADNAEADPDQATLVAHVTGDQIVAYGGPASSRVVGTFSNPNRHGTELVFQSLTEPGSALVDSGWIPVLLPMRPNGTVGWIRTDEVELTRNPYRIEVDVDDFTLTVFRGDRLHLQTAVGIGEGETPTPYGSFYLTDLLRTSDPSGIYGPYAYGLSGFSETLSSFNGGAGVIGIHGTNQPWALGTRVSHGCIRVDNDEITKMAAFLPLGTPVVIGDDPQSTIGRERTSDR